MFVDLPQSRECAGRRSWKTVVGGLRWVLQGQLPVPRLNKEQADGQYARLMTSIHATPKVRSRPAPCRTHSTREQEAEYTDPTPRIPRLVHLLIHPIHPITSRANLPLPPPFPPVHHLQQHIYKHQHEYKQADPASSPCIARAESYCGE